MDYEKNATYRLFREQCVFNNITNGFVKDLESSGRELKDIIIVDNSPGAYLLQPENGIPIQTWIDDPEDYNLIQLIPILEFLSTVEDVRIYIKKIVKNNSLNIVHALNILKRELKIPNNNFKNCNKIAKKEKQSDNQLSYLSDKISNKIRSEESKEKYNVNKLLHESKEGLNLMYSNLKNPTQLEKKSNRCLVDAKNKVTNETIQSKIQNRFMQNLMQPNSTKNLLNSFNNLNQNTVKSNDKFIDKIFHNNFNKNEEVDRRGVNNKYTFIQPEESKYQGFSPKYSKKGNNQKTPIKNKSNPKNVEAIISQSYTNNQVNDSLNNLFIKNNNGMSAYERYKQKVLKNGNNHHISTSKGPFKLRYEDQNDEIVNLTSKKPKFLLGNSTAAAQKRINSSHSTSIKGDPDLQQNRVNSSSNKLQTPRKSTEKKRYNSTSKIIQSSNNANKKIKETPTKLKKQSQNYTERSNIEYSSISSNNLLQPKSIMSEIKRISSMHLENKDAKIGNQTGFG